MPRIAEIVAVMKHATTNTTTVAISNMRGG
jgi:hypothetical protein